MNLALSLKALLFSATALCGMAACAPAEPAAPAPEPAAPAPAEFWVGGDVSFVARIEQLGGVYKDKGQPRDALDILADRGSNMLRLRLWVDPDGQNMNISSLPYTLALAKRVKERGFKLLLDIHYSDTWADPGQQATPKAWKDLSFGALTAQVEAYSRQVIVAFREAGAMPDAVQIGNETPNGMLWPEGRVSEPGGWKKYGSLIKAGIRGVRAGSAPLKPPLTMLHINNAAQKGLATWFFDSLQFEQQQIDFDLIGLSYYPEAGMKLADLKQSLDIVARKYHKPIVIAEVGFPFGGVPEADKAKWEFEPTPEGQKRFLQALIALVRATPEGLGRGVLWWEPTWIPVQGLGHYYGDKMLFDHEGNALPALDALTTRGK